MWVVSITVAAKMHRNNAKLAEFFGHLDVSTCHRFVTEGLARRDSPKVRHDFTFARRGVWNVATSWAILGW